MNGTMTVLRTGACECASSLLFHQGDELLSYGAFGVSDIHTQLKTVQQQEKSFVTVYRRRIAS